MHQNSPFWAQKSKNPHSIGAFVGTVVVHQGNACGPQGGVKLWKWPSGSERLDSTDLDNVFACEQRECAMKSDLRIHIRDFCRSACRWWRPLPRCRRTVWSTRADSGLSCGTADRRRTVWCTSCLSAVRSSSCCCFSADARLRRRSVALSLRPDHVTNRTSHTTRTFVTFRYPHKCAATSWH